MINRKGVIGFFIFIVFSLGFLYAEETVHVVLKGETIYSIARSFKVDRDELMKFNGITDPLRLREGQRLKIPGSIDSAVPAPIQGRDEYYKAVPGDTFYGIARKYGVSVDELLKANSLSPSYILKQGDVLRLPGAFPVSESPVQPQLSPVQETQSRIVDPALRWPVNARELDYLTGKLSGVAITGERAEAVKSLTRGTVISAGPYRGFGRVAIIQAEGGYLYVYGGCESLSVQEGDKVGPETELGRLGIDAVSGKPRLFFMVYRSNIPIDPAKAPRA